ncbi:putative F-box protein At1g50870 [Triticum urartu]|uniref:F-box domain-containing protein n=1 Tax=Triticum urartu TaxID=4572 RepID=A0A8R7V6A7_TRIUA|nr:putative F-box protein At1g50870 [Triticum urartu]XP_048544115.1 putative F-box protein At1g50870 [Triticum urartu]
MPDRREATLLEDLPEEIIDKILKGLPPKDVGRCRAVSTLWRSITSIPEFMLEHHRRQPLLPIIDGLGRPASFVLFRGAGADTSNQQLWPFIPGLRHYHLKPTLSVTCDGFLILLEQNKFYIYNPVLHKRALLPYPQAGENECSNIIGFYRHQLTGEYRLLWTTFRPLSVVKYSLYILTVGSGVPRHIRIRMPTVLSPSAEHKLLGALCYSNYCPPPVHLGGSLHWCPFSVCGVADITGGSRDIVVFDTKAESFRWMRSPDQAYPNRKLFDMNGTLGFWGSSIKGDAGGCLSFTALDIWVMQDYKAEIWAFKYRIDLSTVEASRQLYLTSCKGKKKAPLRSTVQWFNDMAVLNEHELLIMFNDKHVLRCNTDGMVLGLVNIGKSQYCMSLTSHRFQESIIPIPSFP